MSTIIMLLFLLLAAVVMILLALLFVFLPLVWWGFCHLLDELVKWEEGLT